MPKRTGRRSAAALVALVLMQGTAAVAGPMTIAGGALDPAYDKADIYLETPPSASVPQGRACQVAARYVELINGGDYPGAAALYADDATFLEPMRPSLKGRAQIDEFYVKTIGAMKPHVIAVAYTGDDRECMVALANRTVLDGKERYHLASVDHFIHLASVDHFILREDGRIDSMVAFARPR